MTATQDLLSSYHPDFIFIGKNIKSHLYCDTESQIKKSSSIKATKVTKLLLYTDIIQKLLFD